MTQMSPPSPRMTVRAWTEMALLATIWGASFLAIKVALGEVPVITLVAHRVTWAALILAGYLAWRGLPLPRDAGSWRALAVMGLLNNVLPFTLMAWGQQHIETGLTSIFNAATAVFGVLVAAAVFADERLTARRLAGVLLAFAGVSLAIGLDALQSLDIRSLAQLAVLGGALSYAVAASWARARLGHLAPQVAAAGMLICSGTVMVPLALLVDGRPSLPARPETWAAIAWFAVAGTAVAYLLYYRVLSLAGSGNAMLVTLLIPPVAILLGWLVLDERLAPWALAGFALLAAGLVVMNRRVRGGGRPLPAGRSS